MNASASARGRNIIRTARTAAWHLRSGGVPQLKKWWRRRNVVTPAAAPAVATPLRARIVLDEPPARREKRRKPVVAAILDEFSWRAWQETFDLVAVTPVRWREELAERPVDLLFVESAWHGNGDAWQYQLTGSKAPSKALRELVEHCKETGIPTVFWNKEDPPHFEDFLGTAALFDYVFTTDEGKLSEYRARLGHDRLGVLPFAAAEHIHNPARLRHGHQVRDVAFAGTYFAHKFPERREQMDLLLGGALDVSPRMEHGLEIFSRFMDEDERYQFPGELGERVVGSLGYDDMLTAYKAFKVFLNVNSVVDSPSMCARRIFEIAASGTPVVTTRSAAVPNFFAGDEVPVADSREEAGHVVRALVNSPELRDRTVHKAQRVIWEGHTYRHRARTVLEAAGLPVPDATRKRVTALISTNRPHQLEHALRSAGAQAEVDVQVALVTHGFLGDDPELRAMAADFGVADLQIAHMDEAQPLGACLRQAVSMADGDVLTKMDDDDFYAPNYLRDLLNALQYSGASVVGKQAHYMYVASLDATMLRFPHREHRWTDRVMGPTMTGYRDVFEAVPFADLTRGEDSDWLDRVVRSGATIYSADRFNFIQQRSGGHTWAVGDKEILATGEVKQFGRAEAHVAF